MEEIICTTPLLSDFDVELSLLYNEAYEKADNKAEFRREQLDWLQSRNSCMDKNCVVNLYIFRLAKLRKLAAAIPNRSVFEVVDAGGLVGVSSSATIDIKACNTSANNINIIDGQ